MTLSSIHLRRPHRPERFAPADRLRAATALERLVEEADAPHSGLSAASPEHCEAVRAARRAVLTLARELQDAEHPDAALVHEAERLAAGGAAPLYSRTGAVRLAAEARRLEAALRRRAA